MLAFLSIVAGFVNTPAALGNVHAFSNFINGALPQVIERAGLSLTEMGSEGLVMLALAFGVFTAYLLFLKRPTYSATLTRPAAARALHAFWFADWGFDWLYDKAFVQPILWAARTDKHDFIDAFYAGVARINEFLYRALSRTETGRVRWYAAGIAAGAIVFVAIAVLA